jgi:hypothetical protein
VLKSPDRLANLNLIPLPGGEVEPAVLSFEGAGGSGGRTIHSPNPVQANHAIGSLRDKDHSSPGRLIQGWHSHDGA